MKRRKHRQFECWKQKLQKYTRYTEQEYINSKGNLVPVRKVESACYNCLFKCTEQINNEAYQLILSSKFRD